MPCSFTLEASFAGPSRGPLAGVHYNTAHLARMGAAVAVTLLDYASPAAVAAALRELHVLVPPSAASLLLAAHSSAACQAQTADAQVGCILWSGGSALLSCLASCRWVHRQPPATEPPVCRLQGRLFSKLELKFCSHLVSADLRYRAWPRGAGCLCPKSVGEPKSVIVSLLCAQASVVETRWIVQ